MWVVLENGVTLWLCIEYACVTYINIYQFDSENEH